MLRPVARFLRHAPDRLLHARRRDAARRVLAGCEGGKALFVCHGNICRSPYAEHALRRDLSLHGTVGWHTASAGFVKPGRPSPEEAQSVARERSVELAAHRSRVLSSELVGSSDLVFVMSGAQKRDLLAQFETDPDRVLILGDLDPLPIRKRTIRDPVEQPEQVFESVYDRIDRCVEVIAAELRPSGVGPD